MTLNALLDEISRERQRRGIAFAIDPHSGAIGTRDPLFRSPLEFLADCRGEPSDVEASSVMA